MMEEPHDEDTWAADWIDSVTDGSMTQRKLTTVERHGGLSQLLRTAEARGVHLLLLTDDKGVDLIAASKHPFKVIC